MIGRAQKEFIKLLESISPERNCYEVFCDFLQMAGLSFAQVGHFDESREQLYLKTIGKYSKEDQQKFPQLLALVVDGLNAGYCDFLGEIYMESNFGSSRQGQFFTPYSVCRLCAEVNVKSEYDNSRIITVADPCIGGAAMVIAMAEALQLRGFNYQQNMLVSGTDVSINSVYMALIHLSILGIPAVIVHGNSLSLEQWGVYTTPAFSYTLIQERYRAQCRRDEENNYKAEQIVLDTDLRQRDYKQQSLFED
ncbi:MAG: N-6 DNA methylase [Treponema sp.]|nr:N-6 DNA methylase [Treponema sp.]